jgi:formylglycine-generating enzyme required for sulfatase activity
LAKIPLLKAEIEELIQRGLNAYLGSLQSEYDSRSIGEGSLSAGIISCDHALHRIEELTEHLENPATADDMRACVLECSGDLRWQMLNAKIEPLVCRGDWAGALEVIDTEGQGRTLEENGLEEMEELPTFTTFAALRTSTLTASRDGRVSGAWCRFISRIREHFTIAAPRYGSWRGARWLTDARRQELATKRQKLVDKLVSVQRRKVIVRRCITASSIIAFVLIAALTINASRRNNAFRRACAAGETAMAADDYATAQGHFANALRIKPGHPATVGRLQQAIENEERSVAEAKRLAEQYMLAVADGQKLLAAEDWPKAEAAFTRALAVKGYGNAPEATTGLRDAKDGAAMQRRKATAKTECDRTIQAATDLLALATNNRAPAAARGQTAEALTAIDRTLTSQKDSLSPSDQSALSALRDRIVTFQGTLKPKVDCTWSVPDLGMVFQPVPAGSFQMGTDVPKVPRSDDEKPQHGVRISQPYWLGNTEITQGQWQAVMGNNPSYVKGVDFPVEMVTWNDAISFCTKLTEREQSAGRLPVGYVYRLPTEAEWEYAARGGRKSKGYEYSGSNNLDDVGWYAKNSGNISKRDVLDTTLKSHPVGRKKPNELGLYDMSGNVEEWCHDWGGKYPPGSVTDPRGAQSGAGRITRGGSWWGEDAFCRSADRNERSPSTRDNRLGFRVCLGSVVQ